MSISWYLMDGQKDYYSGFEKDEFGQKAIDRFSELLEISPEAYNVQINKKDDRVILQNRKESNNTKRILSKIDHIATGDIVTYKKEDWIVVTQVDDNRVYHYGTIEKCNQALNFQLQDSTIHSFPCVISNKTSFKDGTEHDRHMIMATGHLNIAVSANDSTLQIKIDKRFIIGREAWKVIFIDSLTVPGIIFITIEKDELLPQDNIDLEIANFIEEKDIVTPPNESQLIRIEGPSFINQKRVETFHVIGQGDGYEIPKNEPVLWSIYDDDKNSITENAEIIEQAPQTCKVRNNIKSGYVQLKATLESDKSIVTWKRIELKGLW